MSEIYKLLEKEIQEIENIESWNEKVCSIKKIKENISIEQAKLNELINNIAKNDLPTTKISKKKEVDIDALFNTFDETTNLEDKIKLYHMINNHINHIEKQLFSN